MISYVVMLMWHHSNVIKSIDINFLLSDLLRFWARYWVSWPLTATQLPTSAVSILPAELFRTQTLNVFMNWVLPTRDCKTVVNQGVGGGWFKNTFELLNVHICINLHLSMYGYFLSKANISNVNCARATAFIFDTRTVFLGKCQIFLDRKCLDLRGTPTPNLRIHTECSNLLSYQGQTFAIPCCWILALAV